MRLNSMINCSNCGDWSRRKPRQIDSCSRQETREHIGFRGQVEKQGNTQPLSVHDGVECKHEGGAFAST